VLITKGLIDSTVAIEMIPPPISTLSCRFRLAFVSSPRSGPPPFHSNGCQMGKPPAFSAFLALLYAAFACFNSGCQTTALRVSTTAQSQSVTEFYYQQVLQNMAYLHDNPNGLPYFSVAGQGQTAIGDTVSATDMVGFDVLSSAATGFTGLLGHLLLDKQYATLAGSRLSTQTWITQTTISPDRLALMRCAYLRVLGSPDPDCYRKLGQFLGPADPPCRTPRNPSWDAMCPGWFFVCKRSAVPKQWACEVGYCGDTAVWVPAAYQRYLSDFTRVILDMASVLNGNSHIEAAILTLRAQAKDLGDLLKYNNESQDQTVKKLNQLGMNELHQAYAETLIQLELAMLEKAFAETTDKIQRDDICKRIEAITGRTVPVKAGETGAGYERYVRPYAAPVLVPRLNLNLAPIYLNPPGG
jgi:hypothetical protein